MQVTRQKTVFRLLQPQANMACLEAGSELWAQCSPAQKKFTVQQVHRLLVEGRAAGKRSFQKPTNGQVQQSADIIVLEYEVLAALKYLCGSLVGELPTQNSCVMWRGSSTKTFAFWKFAGLVHLRFCTNVLASLQVPCGSHLGERTLQASLVISFTLSCFNHRPVGPPDVQLHGHSCRLLWTHHQLSSCAFAVSDVQMAVDMASDRGD